MRVQIARRLQRSTLAAALVFAVFPPAAGATTASDVRVMPRVGPVITRASVPASRTVWHAVRPGSHVLYGTIAALRGTIVNLRLRSGQLFAVDATTAIAGGNYSAPLFVGKVVAVDGEQAGGRFTATHIFRLTNLANLPTDH